MMLDASNTRDKDPDKLIIINYPSFLGNKNFHD